MHLTVTKYQISAIPLVLWLGYRLLPELRPGFSHLVMLSGGSRNPIRGPGHATSWLNASREGGVPIMHPCSPALRLMVERKTAQARFTDPMVMEPAELERSILRALSDLSSTRPRIVEFAPDVALKRALERVYAADRDRDVVQVPAFAGRAQRLPATG